jgi:hypothetical protein
LVAAVVVRTTVLRDLFDLVKPAVPVVVRVDLRSEMQVLQHRVKETLADLLRVVITLQVVAAVQVVQVEMLPIQLAQVLVEQVLHHL